MEAATINQIAIDVSISFVFKFQCKVTSRGFDKTFLIIEINDICYHHFL